MNSKVPGKKVIGAKQTLKAIKNGAATIVFVAEDADQKVTKPIVEACLQNNLELVYISTIRELGKMCDIDVGAATACSVKEQ
jgi:large subunit ribosomal protein L7A